MSKIVTIGSGLIGQAWAAVFAKAGFKVAMYDQSPEAAERAIKAMETRIADLVEFDLIKKADAPTVLGNIEIASSLDDAIDGAIYIQESVPERLEVKIAVTKELDSIAPSGVPIGSSTSGISASRYCEHVEGRSRCLVVHPINPPHLIPAVELVPTPWTDQQTISTVSELMTQSSREVIVLNEEIDGFVVNRLQGALLEEAFSLVGSGIVSATDLDKAISHGLGLRWALMGPMETIHLNAPGGVTQYVERYGAMYRNFNLGNYDSVNWGDIVEEKLRSELEKSTPVSKIPEAQEMRDRKLMALLRHKATMDASNKSL